MAKIEKISFEIETITPMFLSGANQNGVELRPQSIKGMLRYWYRALLGGIGITSINELKELESNLWGKEEQGSSVSIRVKHFNIKKKDTSSLGLGGEKLGMTYMLFSVKMNKRPYIDVGTIFSIELTSNRHDAQKWLSLAACSLWCWINLGAIGTRSRRGGGDLKIIKASENKEVGIPDVKTDFSNTGQYREYISQGLTFCLNKVAELNGLQKRGISGQVCFPLINSSYLIIYVADKSWNNWQSVMEEVGRKFMNFRRKKEPDYSNIKNYITRNDKFVTVERAYFGFPIIFRYNSLRGRSVTVEGSSVERRASPLWFKFIKLSSNVYTIALIISHDKFLPTGEGLRIKKQGGTLDLNCPSKNVLDDFVNELTSFNLQTVTF